MSHASLRLRRDGRPITPRELARGIRVNYVAGAMGNMWVAVALGMPLIMLMESLGASGFMIGLVTTLQQLAILAQIPGSLYAERLPERKTFWARLAVFHRLLWFIPALLPLFMPGGVRLTAWLILGVVGLSSSLANAAAASWYSWMADLIPDYMRGRFWGQRQSWVTLAFLAAMGLAGYTLDLFGGEGGNLYQGFALVFGAAASLGTADILVHLGVPEPRPKPARPAANLMEKLLSPLREPNFRWFTLAYAAWFFTLGLVMQFGNVYLKRDFGATYSHLAIMIIASSLGTILLSPVSGYLIDRLGARTFGAVSILLAPLFGGAWFFIRHSTVTWVLPLWGTVTLPQAVALLLIVNFFAGGFYAGVLLAQLGLSSALAPREGRTVAMAMHWSVVGLLSAAGPLVGGAIMDHLAHDPLRWQISPGVRFSFFHVLVVLHVAVAWLAALPLLLKVERRAGEVPLGTALSRLIVVNPLRVVRDIYSIHVCGADVGPAERAEALRVLGRDRAAVAVGDLIASLDDPSFEVREQAASALAAVGGPEAVEALVDKLEDPHSDLAPQIARALRHLKDPRSVGALVRRLGDPDRETRVEAVRALGEIGDRGATAHLLELLRGSEEDKVVAASGEALARLGEIAALHDILPRLRQTYNPVLKRSLALAAGDLLGEPDGFYRLLQRERRTRGEEVGRRLRQLRLRLNSVPPALRDSAKALSHLSENLERAYEAGKSVESRDLLFRLGLGMAAFAYGEEYGGEARAQVDELVWRDQRFGQILRYLEDLSRAEEPAEPGQFELELLLGIYALTRD